MPNWCYNSIQITGEPKNLKKLQTAITMIRGANDDEVKNRLFQGLIGLPEGTNMDEYNNQGWYDVNVGWFGTKWDVNVDEFVQEMTDDYIYMSGDTAWSPPINFCIELSKLYKVDIEMYYEECGSDFCGKTCVDSEGNHTEEDYEYQEGIYRFEGFSEWYNREFDSALEWMVDEFQDEDELNFIEIIKDHYGFLTDEEVEECASDLEKQMVAATGKEF